MHSGVDRRISAQHFDELGDRFLITVDIDLHAARAVAYRSYEAERGREPKHEWAKAHPLDHAIDLDMQGSRQLGTMISP
jgi:hypothetical protein